MAIKKLRDTAPGPDRVRNTEFKRLSNEHQNELLELNNESLENGDIPADRTLLECRRSQGFRC